jgi:hypothetical protein
MNLKGYVSGRDLIWDTYNPRISLEKLRAAVPLHAMETQGGEDL